MAKVIDFLQKFIFNGIDGESPLNKKAASDVQEKIAPRLNNIENLKKETEEYNRTIENIRHQNDLAAKALNEAKEKLAVLLNQGKEVDHKLLLDAKESYEEARNAEKYASAQVVIRERAHEARNNAELKERKRVNELIIALAKKHNMTQAQIRQLGETVGDESFNLDKETLTFNTSMKKIHSAASGGFSNLIADMGGFFAEFAVIGSLIEISFHQIQELNKQVVEFNRSMGQGQLSSKMVGSDMFGNTNMGSLASLTLMNAISEKEFFSSFNAFGKGKALGGNEDFFSQQENMRQFGVGAAQLSKFYGIEMGTINTITSNLVYNFGTKVKDLNEIFANGKEQASAAGLSVKEYFNNLKEASDQVGKHYIAGGVEGLQKLAFYATATGQAVSAVLASTGRFKNFTSQYELQNTAASLGFGNATQNMRKAWSLSVTGQQAESQKLLLTSLASDIKRNGLLDKSGMISGLGQMNLEGLGMGPEEIATIQKWVTKMDKSGIAIEAWNDRIHQSTDMQARMYEFEHKNLTMGERVGEIWGKIKSAIIDPFAGLIAPIIDGLLGVVKIIVDMFGPVLKAILWPLALLGKALAKFQPVIDAIGAFTDGISKCVDDWIGDSGFLGKAFGVLVGVVEGVIISLIAFEASLMLSSGVGKVGRLFGMGSKIAEGAEGAATGGFFKRAFARGGRIIGGESELMSNLGPSGMTMLKGVGGGAAIGIGGSLLSNYIGDKVGGRGGNSIKTIGSAVSSGAGTGMMVGTAFAPETLGLSILAGAVIGAIGGIAEDAMNNMDKVYQDGSTGFWASMKHEWTDFWDWVFNKKTEVTAAIGQAAESHAPANNSEKLRDFVSGGTKASDVAKYGENNSQQMHPQQQITIVNHIKTGFTKTQVDIRK